MGYCKDIEEYRRRLMEIYRKGDLDSIFGKLIPENTKEAFDALERYFEKSNDRD